jgi:CPA1 family monovalent cation:H+ antiporter
MVKFGWAGMRGVVSMAAALGLPVILASGENFKNRELIIYLSFCVILITLLLLGGSLKWIVRKLKIEPYSLVAEEYDVRNTVVKTAISYIEDNLSLVQEDLLDNIKSKYEVKYNRLQKTDLPANYFGKGKMLAGNVFNEYSQLQIDLLKVERQTIQQMHKKGGASEEILRKIERELDLEETRLKLEIYDSDYYG